ncbi:RNA polymerase subunit sigma-70 [Enterococcus hirae]|uniref:RNA polymerase subunit sigma-70 n=1 Tax=Enterococcus TaxID=1350 RepID=UPI000BBC3087|nr:RNA polymerase subunit sigma-70 [Enterococcus hirae]EMF0260466.1 RNA polymerase subunit sigma-70 [Enterococcus hirae]EMF0287330.1 RNA polymerase subunit sigma-70 [Enterococcus hirae]MCC4033926.1 RNA polymerase subunit sigma-70 [Enterococcus hirae]MDU1931490.1 RNA polymerase subunit sigma-70 [Enterococcus hirae]NBA55457.1 RNA polymerase subunit sigma-70 [Enterococcus hirae]
MTIDLLELREQGIVKPGGHHLNVPINKVNGQPYDGTTYMIPLEYLYYNDQNGRIGVSLSEYESINGPLEAGHNEDYNNAIQEMLISGGGEKTKKEMQVLKRDMSIKGQQEAGYVLLDGRVIDGNRRFTAKRMLEQDPAVSEPQFYEAVILDDLSMQNHTDQKLIKSLELQIQFGKLDKVDYNPIDRSIDAYKTIKVNNIMNAKDYAEYAGLKVPEVNKRLLEAELIVRFLDFANASPDNYALAKQLDLDGPLQDLVPQYKKFKNNENADQLLNSLFTKILQIRLSGEDYKSEYRQIVKNIIGTKEEEKFIDDMEDATDTVVDALDSKTVIRSNIELFTTLNSQETTSALSKVQTVSNRHSEAAKNKKERDEPAKLVSRAISALNSIDTQSVASLSNEDSTELIRSLDELQKLIDEIRSNGE